MEPAAPIDMPSPPHGPLARVLGRSLRDDSLVFTIAHDLGSAIIEGRLPAGASISSVDVALRFNTSRAPVRDALLVLEREGLISTSVGRASRVTHVPLKDIREIYEIRAELHALVAQRFVRSASDDGIATLRALNARLVAFAEAGDVDAFFWLNLEYRDVEAHAAGNERLRQLLDSVGLQTLVVRHAGIAQPGRLAESVRLHEQQLQAYEARNEGLAIAVMRTIVIGSLAMVERANWAGMSP
jgi:DNA-binding GntR family transcriptional regulator